MQITHLKNSKFIIVLSLKIHYANISALLIIADHKFTRRAFLIFGNSPLNRMFLCIFQNNLREAIIIINIHNIWFYEELMKTTRRARWPSSRVSDSGAKGPGIPRPPCSVLEKADTLSSP